jgi:hypothetical protein
MEGGVDEMRLQNESARYQIQAILSECPEEQASLFQTLLQRKETSSTEFAMLMIAAYKESFPKNKRRKIPKEASRKQVISVRFKLSNPISFKGF